MGGFHERVMPIVWLLLCLCMFSLVDAHEIASDAVVLSWNYSGDYDPFLEITTPLHFNASAQLLNGTLLDDSDYACEIKIASLDLRQGMAFDPFTQKFRGSVSISNPIYNDSFRIECRSTNASRNINSSSTTFSVTEPYLPLFRVIDGVSNYSRLFPDVSYNFSIQLFNVTGSTFVDVPTTDSCNLTHQEATFDLVTAEFADVRVFFSDQIRVDDSGIVSFLMQCRLNSQVYRNTVQLLYEDYVTALQRVAFDPDNANSAHAKFIVMREDEFDEPYVLLSRSPSVSKYELYSVSNLDVPLFTKGDLIEFRQGSFATLGGYSGFFIGQDYTFAQAFDYRGFDTSYTLSSEFNQSMEEIATTTFDYDNDGDIDILTSFDKTTKKTHLIRNDKLGFTESFTDIVNISNGFHCYEDFNSDGFYDVLVAGNEGSQATSRLYYYNNEKNPFILYQTLSTGYQRGSCFIGNFLEDNSTDVFLFGDTGTGIAVGLYNNLSMTENIASERFDFEGVVDGDLIVADFDNDGLSDVLICGRNQSHTDVTYFYKQNQTNHGYFYRQTVSGLNYNISSCSLSALDQDRDGDLDIAISGVGSFNGSANVNPIHLLNNTAATIRVNQLPTAPKITNVTFANNTLFIAWNHSQDDLTSTDKLTYNLHVEYANGSVIQSGLFPLSTRPAQGYLGNMRYRTNHTLREVQSEFVKVRLQAMDNGLQRSAWNERSIECEEPQTTEWVINNDCSITQSAFAMPHAITVNSGTLSIINDLNANGSNMTIRDAGSIAANSRIITDALLIIQTPVNLTNVTLQGMLISNRSSTFTDSYVSRLVALEKVTLRNTQFSTLEVFNTTATLWNTISLAYVNQFGHAVAGVEHNLSGVFSTQTSQLLLFSTVTSNTSFTGLSRKPLQTWVNNSYIIRLQKPSHYNATHGIVPEQRKAVQLRINQTPQPYLGIFENGFSTSLAENLTNDEQLDRNTLSSVDKFKIGLPSLAYIQWHDPVDVRYINFSKVLNISKNWVSVNVNEAQGLNQSANITLVNLSYEKQPTIFRNGLNCAECSQISYNGSQLSFTTPGFSNFTTVNNSQLEYQSPSVIVVGETYSARVHYTKTENRSDSISGATCSYATDDSFFSGIMLEKNERYTASLNYTTTSPELVNITIRCTHPEFENSTLVKQLRKFWPGQYFLLDQVYPGVELSSAVAFNHTITYEGFFDTNKQLRASFLPFTAEIVGVGMNAQQSSASYVDFDNDGEIERVSLGDFSVIPQLGSVQGGSLLTFDMDSDGDIDMVYCGLSSGAPSFSILENHYDVDHEEARFTVTDYPHLALQDCRLVLWKNASTNYLYAQGSDATLTDKAFLLSVSDNVSIEQSASLAGLRLGDAISLFHEGTFYVFASGISQTLGNRSSVVYRFEDNSLARLESLSRSFANLSDSSILSAKFGHETEPTILISGKETLTETRLYAYRFNGTHLTPRDGLFQDVSAFSRSSAVFTDLNDDHLPDLFVTGDTASGEIAHVYLFSDTADLSTNTAPTPPALSLYYNTTTNQLSLNWSNATDDDTKKLSYNLRVGDAINPDRFVSGAFGSSSNPAQQQLGNQFYNTHAAYNLPNACLQAQIQALDAAYTPSAWSAMVQYATGEICDDRYDNDCDGVVDEGCSTSGGIQSGTNRGGGGSFYTPPQLASSAEDIAAEDQLEDPASAPPEEISSEGGSSSTAEQQGYFTTTFSGFEVRTEVSHLEGRTFVSNNIRNTDRTAKTQIKLFVTFDTTLLADVENLRSLNDFERERNRVAFAVEDVAYLQEATVLYSLSGIHDVATFENFPLWLEATGQLSEVALAEVEAQQIETAAAAIAANLTERVVDNQTVIRVEVDLRQNVSQVQGIEIEQFIPKMPDHRNYGYHSRGGD